MKNGEPNSLVGIYVDLYTSLLRDLAYRHKDLGYSGFDQDLLTILNRSRSEGLSFFTKQLPKLGKAIDKSLATDQPLAIEGWKTQPSTVLPVFLGGIFNAAFSADGVPLDAESCGMAVRSLRQVCFLLYKQELPHTDEQNRNVLVGFKATDALLAVFNPSEDAEASKLIGIARQLLARVTCSFDPYAITPRHGPGAVATGEKPWEKMRFKRFYPTIDEVYPYSEYFYCGAAHLCDELDTLRSLEDRVEPEAKVILVPKDSRGPRLISEEPLELQWLQQGLSRALVKHVEDHPITRGRVNFTSQEVNRGLALLSSCNRQYVTLDMKDASDRVSLELVKQLFEPRIARCLTALRSQATRLPDGTVVRMLKYAPMGSALCFPVEALCFFSLVTAIIHRHHGIPLLEAARSVFVYGDDIIVPFEVYEAVLQHIPRFGLMFNEAKCCTTGFFRESCGCDAYRGVDVTPLKMRKVWCSSTEVVQSYVAYSNWLYKNGYSNAAEYLRGLVLDQFGPIPLTTSEEVDHVAFLCYGGDLGNYNDSWFRKRYNKHLQRLERYVPQTKGIEISQPPAGWCSLLEFFSRRENAPREFDRVKSLGTYAVPNRSYLKMGWSPI